MPTYRVLLLGAKDGIPSDLASDIERDSGREIVAEASTTISDAIRRVAKNEYDAVVCWVEREDELAGVIRIRKTRPELPILVVTSIRDAHFADRARQAGAVRTAENPRNSAALSETIRLAVQSGGLRRELLSGARWAPAPASAEQSRSAARGLRSRSARFGSGQFVPLLVEDDPDQVSLMEGAFERADVVSGLPVMKSGEEAIAYFSEAAPFEKPDRGGAPTLVLLDIELPGKSGFEVLEWIRSQPKLHRLPVVILSCSSSPEYVNRAYQLGANSYLVKPTTFEALIDMVSSLKQYWGSNQA
jgi:DNA-binding NarL/FixJ family response regulator